MECIFCLDENGALYKNNYCNCKYIFHKECFIHLLKDIQFFTCPLCRKLIILEKRNINDLNYIIYGIPQNLLAFQEYEMIDKRIKRQYTIYTLFICLYFIFILYVIIETISFIIFSSKNISQR